MQQTGRQTNSPIPGLKKNCTAWAEYEPPGSSASANLCHGGPFDGEVYEPCPARNECRHATRGDLLNNGRSLPVLNQARPFGNSRPGSTLLASTPNVTPTINNNLNTQWRRSIDEWKTRPVPLPSSIPARQQQEAYSVQQGLPYPVMPPQDWPTSMRTPYAAPIPMMDMGISPTFLPEDGEDVIERLVKNVVQGALAAVGWHIFNYARTLDLFRLRKNKQ